jgi:chromosome segregation ATPase
MFNPSNSNRRFVLNPAPPPPNFVPTEASWPPRTILSDGSNAHAVVNKLIGARKPLSIEAAFQRIESELTKTENLDLLNESLNLQQRVVARLAEQKEQRLAGLKADHEAARQKARSWLEKCRSMRESLNAFESTLNALKMSASESRANFAAVRESAPRPEDYPNDQEIQEWQARMAEAETVAASEEERSRTAELDRQRMAADLLKALENFKIAEQAEALLRFQLLGQPYKNSLGIVIEPEA